MKKNPFKYSSFVCVNHLCLQRTIGCKQYVKTESVPYHSVAHKLRTERRKKQSSLKIPTMFFPQDPMILYQQSAAYMQSTTIPRSSQSRPSFLIDDLLVPRQHPYLLPKQTSYQEHSSTVPVSSTNSALKFGMPSILSPRQQDTEPTSMYQGKCMKTKL